MLKLSSNRVVSLGSLQKSGVIVRRVSKNPDYVNIYRSNEYFIVRDHSRQVPKGFAEYLFFATIETVCTVIIIQQAWTWRKGAANSSAELSAAR